MFPFLHISRSPHGCVRNNEERKISDCWNSSRASSERWQCLCDGHQSRAMTKWAESSKSSISAPTALFHQEIFMCKKITRWKPECGDFLFFFFFVIFKQKASVVTKSMLICDLANVRTEEACGWRIFLSHSYLVSVCSPNSILTLNMTW